MVAIDQVFHPIFERYFERALSLGLRPNAAEDAAASAVLEAWRAEAEGCAGLSDIKAATGFARAVAGERRQPVLVEPGEAVRLYEAERINGTRGWVASWVLDESIDACRISGIYEALGVSEDGFAMYIDGLGGLTLGPNLDFSRINCRAGGQRIH